MNLSNFDFKGYTALRNSHIGFVLANLNLFFTIQFSEKSFLVKSKSASIELLFDSVIDIKYEDNTVTITCFNGIVRLFNSYGGISFTNT